MQSFSKFFGILLLAVTPFAEATHYRHSHRSPSGLPSGYSYPTGAPFASGPNAPYPAGNGTGKEANGIGTAGTVSNTHYQTIQSTIYIASQGSEGTSPAPTGAAGGYAAEPGGAAPSEAGGLGLELHASTGALGEAGSSCAAPATVTVTSDITVTVTGTPSASEASVQVPILVESQFGATNLGSVEPEGASITPMSSQTGSVTPLASAPIIPGLSSAAAAIGPLSSNDGVPYSAPISSSALPEVGEDLPGFIPPTLSASSAPNPTITAKQLNDVPATPSASVAASTSSADSPSSSLNGNSLTPNGIKAGVAGYRSITEKSSWNKFAPHIGWYSDYWPDTPDSGSVTGIGMLWGDGHQGGNDASRLVTFKALSSTPKYMMGFFEPDFTPPDSSDIPSTSAASSWSSLIAPLGKKGTLLGSPSLATQKDESWLTPFESAPEHPTWDYTCIHTNKPTVEGVKEDVEYYLAKYKKPIWVSEFACVEDKTWTPCVDANQIKSFIQDVVDFFQKNENVVAYGYSNGNGLGTAWPMFDSNGGISASGQVYLDAISVL